MLPLILTLALNGSAPVTPADGTYTYSSSLSGQKLGTTTLTVKHSATGLSVEESASATIAGQAVAATTTQVVNSQLTPTSYDANYNNAGQKLHAALSFANGSAKQTSDVAQLSNKSYDLTANAKGFVIIDGALVGGFFLLPAQMAQVSGGPVIGIAPVYGQAFPISADTTAKPARPAAVPATDVSLSVGSPVPFTEWYDPKTMLFDELDVPSQNIIITRTR
ncbi:MAG: hypothetical protein M3Y21_08275 [Candidatus Eremiobacteraeota bacterium]|nr:hypothetical protein [Candidatus Eremiobacteraeota bacterium]